MACPFLWVEAGNGCDGLAGGIEGDVGLLVFDGYSDALWPVAVECEFLDVEGVDGGQIVVFGVVADVVSGFFG